MLSWPIIFVTLVLPIVGAVFIMLMHREEEAEKRNARWIALWTTLITFAVSLIMLWRFDPGMAEFQFVENRPWLAGTIQYHVGVDGISLPFVILTTGLMPLCIIASWSAIERRVKEYMVAFLVLARFLYEPVGRLHQLNQIFQAGRAAGERVFEIMDEKVEAGALDKPVKLNVVYVVEKGKPLVSPAP